MKTKVLVLITMFLMTTVVVFAGEKTEKFKVYGNCGMCEKRIEKAANSVDGVNQTDWNKETKMMEVTFDAEKTNADAIQKAITMEGHDTEKHKVKEEVYEDLPGCCQYDRAEKEHDHNHEGPQH